MKTIKQYITEFVNINNIKKQKQKQEYKYFPKRREELIKYIKNELKAGNTDLNCIDTSEITSMWQIFNQFNSECCKLTKEQQKTLDISEWNTSKVIHMGYMFNECRYINCDISNWNTSNVKYMNSMFYSCEQFNCDLSNWDVSKVENMNFMFKGSGLEGHEPKWNKK